MQRLPNPFKFNTTKLFMWKRFHLPLIIVLIACASWTHHAHTNPKASKHVMGINIYLKCVASAEEIDQVKDLALNAADSQLLTLNLEVYGQDLAIIFQNSPDFDSDIKHIAYRMLWGN